jgi:lysophospholipid acyltransferase (LPLAT)-like uncharacterized protein
MAAALNRPGPAGYPTMSDVPSLKERLALALIPRVASLLIRLLRLTLRIRYVNRRVVEELRAAQRSYIHAFWHGRLLIMPYSYFGRRISILISRHRDGEYVARVMGLLGFDSTRGSTTSGGALALRQVVRRLHEGWDVAFTPDGPRGPAGVVQPGVVQAARLSGAPIVPVTVAAARAWRIGKWDSFLVPRPFSRVFIAYGEPLRVPAGADDATLDRKRLEVERALHRLTDRADRAVSGRAELAEEPRGA